VTSEALRAAVAEAQQRGFVGPGSVDHAIEHAIGFADGVPSSPARFLDLGSGGGLPGLVLVQRWPKATAALLDANQHRCVFLRDAVEALGLVDRVTVVQARAEDAGRDPAHRGTYDLVVARSFGRPAITAECAAPFLVAGGQLVVSEPPSDAAADRWPADGLALVGLQPETDWVTDLPAHFRSFAQSVPCPDRYPRRAGIPAKRPLF
jgi:16S rRNA (guanine527-N7)-methyltransferase